MTTTNQESMRPEDRRTLKRLAFGAIAMALVAVWLVSGVLGAPLFVGAVVGMFVLCFDTIVITLIWVAYQGR